MKIRRVLTASAAATLIGAANIVPAYANDAHAIFGVHILTSAEVEPSAGTDEPDASEGVTVEESQVENADVSESETLDPAVKVEVQQNATEAETQAEPEVSAPDDPVVQVDKTPIIEPVEISSAVPGSEATVETLSLPSEESAPQAVSPPAQQSAAVPTVQESAAAAVLPSVQESTAATVVPPVQDLASESGTSPIAGPVIELGFLAEGDVTAPAASEGAREIPPAPREVDTVEIENNNSTKSEDEDAQSHQTSEDAEIESADTPRHEPLPDAGASLVVLSLGGLLLLTAAVVLVVRRRHVSE